MWVYYGCIMDGSGGAWEVCVCLPPTGGAGVVAARAGGTLCAAGPSVISQGEVPRAKCPGCDPLTPKSAKRSLGGGTESEG